jgi:fatty-acyl-CoA synthase
MGWSELGAEGPLARGGRALRTLGRIGLLRPRFVVSMSRAYLRHGQSIATGVAAAALDRPNQVAIFDDAGELRFAELNRRIQSIAHGLRGAGIGPGSNVGILCRNHRGFVEACSAVSLLGADAVFLNTGFAGPQLGEVLDREGTQSLIYDEEFRGIVEAHGGKRDRYLAWHEANSGVTTLDELARQPVSTKIPRPAKPGGVTILTSGTTGTPKGAARDSSNTDVEAQLGLLEAMPIKAGVATLVCAPAFHAWGLTHTLTALALGSPIVLQRRFDPLLALRAIERCQIDTLIVVPVMLQRILALGAETCRRHDTSSLRATFSSGSALPGELARAWMDAFGDNLYNFYGSTEVAQASCAGPVDLRAAPGTAGRPPRGAVVKILDDGGLPVPEGETGRIFVGNANQFDGYTGGGGKQVIDGLMSIGDVGYFDSEGRLFVQGRDDDMIVSGGENVFPLEVEDLLSEHPSVLEAAVIGVPDADFGQRLRAFIVLRTGMSVEEADVKELVRSRLARHKVPRDVIFLDEIPRNPTGKVLKRVLRERS